MTPSPKNITNQPQGGGWHRLAWDDVANVDDHGYESVYEWGSGRKTKPESVDVPCSNGSTAWCQLRNHAGGVPSGWVTVTINDRGEIIDIDDPDPEPEPQYPNPPRNLTVSGITASAVRLDWHAPQAGGAAVDHYHLSFSKSGGQAATDTTTSLSYRLTGLDPDSDYAVALTAIAANGHQSTIVTGYWRTEPDEQPPPETPPQPPSGLRLVSTDPEYASAEVAWNPQQDADFWEIVLENVFPRERKANAASYTFSDLTAGSTYSWRLRAVRKATGGKLLRSGWVRSSFTFEDEKPPPPPVPIPKPQGLRSHCITTSTAIVEWDRATGVDGWEVWIGDRTTAAFTTATRHNVKNLRPNTSYTVSVVAIKGDGESEVSTDTFVTLNDEEIHGELPTPTGLHLENPRPGVLQAMWDGQVPEFKPGQRTNEAFYISCDGLETTTQTDRAAHEWTGLASGEYVVEVYRATGGAVSGIARLAASVKGARWS